MTTNDLTYDGLYWKQLTDKQKEASLKVCLTVIFNGHSIMQRSFVRWFLVHSADVRGSMLKRIIAEVREDVSCNPPTADLHHHLLRTRS